MRARVAPKSDIAKALSYPLNRWAALVRYCEDGALAIDNNPVERTIRGAIITVIETCKLHHVDPFAYLCDVLDKLPTWPHKRLSELLPFNWKPSVP